MTNPTKPNPTKPNPTEAKINKRFARVCGHKSWILPTWDEQVEDSVDVHYIEVIEDDGRHRYMWIPATDRDDFAEFMKVLSEREDWYFIRRKIIQVLHLAGLLKPEGSDFLVTPPVAVEGFLLVPYLHHPELVAAAYDVCVERGIGDAD